MVLNNTEVFHSVCSSLTFVTLDLVVVRAWLAKKHVHARRIEEEEKVAAEEKLRTEAIAREEARAREEEAAQEEQAAVAAGEVDEGQDVTESPVAEILTTTPDVLEPEVSLQQLFTALKLHPCAPIYRTWISGMYRSRDCLPSLIQ